MTKTSRVRCRRFDDKLHLLYGVRKIIILPLIVFFNMDSNKIIITTDLIIFNFNLLIFNEY